MMKRAAIVQSSYIPWKGYFSLIQLADAFILYDDVQYTHRDWRNRNRIKTEAGGEWLTIPVTVKGRSQQRVRDACTRDGRWARKHWRAIEQNYCKAPYFAQLGPAIRELYARCAEEPRLSRINHCFLQAVCRWLAIETPLIWSMDLELHGGRTERLIGLCRQVGAAEYLTGPAARAYLDEALFVRAGMCVRWMDYAGYPEYRQLHGPPFIHQVSILDLLLNEGPQGAARYMAAYRELAQARFAAGDRAPSPAGGRAFA